MEFDSGSDGQPENGTPEEEGPSYCFPFRWTHQRRVIMVMGMLNFLTDDERNALIADPASPWPNKGKKATKPYSDMHAQVVADMERELLEHGVDPADWQGGMPSLDSVRDAAQQWTRRFLADGSIINKPPHVKGYKLEANEPYLVAIRQMIMDGYLDSEGNQRLFRDLHHLQKMKGKLFQDIFNKTGLKTLRSLWLQLKTLFPNLGKVTIRLKKKRAEKLVQVCSNTHCLSENV